MNITYVINMLISGLKLGSIYAIVAIGYSIVYGILRLINFAHGDIMTVGVYMILFLMNSMGVPILASVLISVGFSIGVGLLIERFAYRPLRDRSEEATLISSLAVSALLQNLLQMIFSAQRQPFMLPTNLIQVHRIGNVNLSTVNILTFVITAAFLILTYLMLKKTRRGAGTGIVQRCQTGQFLEYLRKILRVVAASHLFSDGGNTKSGICFDELFCTFYSYSCEVCGKPFIRFLQKLSAEVINVQKQNLFRYPFQRDS